MGSLQYRALNLPSCATISACTSGGTLAIYFKVISGDRSAAEASRGLMARALSSAGELSRFTGRTGEFSGEDTGSAVAVSSSCPHSYMDLEYLSYTERLLAVTGAQADAT